jgi:hypothetical protein
MLHLERSWLASPLHGKQRGADLIRALSITMAPALPPEMGKIQAEPLGTLEQASLRTACDWASPACERLTGFEPATSALATPRSDLLSYNRMEPSPGADPGGPPIPRASGRRSEGHSFRELDSNQRAPASRAGRDARNPPRNELEPPPGATPGWPSLQGKPVVGPGAKCPRRDSNAHCPDSHSGASCRWATRTRGPPPGVEPGHPPYEGEAASRARRQSCPSWIRTTIHGFRGRCPAVRRKGIE